WVIEGIEGGVFALVSKVHHCMVDGISGVDLLQVLLSPFPQEDFERAPIWSPRREPKPVELLRDATLRRVRAPRLLRRRLQRSLRDPNGLLHDTRDTLEGIREVVLQGFRPSLDTPLNRPIGPHRRFDWTTMDLDEVKRVKKALGGTVNDVVLAAVAGAVGRYLESHGVPEHDQRNSDFRVFCPVSVRRAGERGALGNRVSSMIARLPIYERHPVRRLNAVSRTMGDLKKSKQALGAEILTSVSEWTSPTLISAAARISFRNRASNMVVTNVPGPQIPLYLLGAKMLETYPMVPLFMNQCLGIALFSYAGALHWGLNADWDQIPDLHEFVAALEESFGELRDAADKV
ncbi:MAG: DUF1298 domain-containing protein, partial [Myxococcales bacterium]|nr:DUF1298 domain-containing protein [Myxococcales bacterium]